MAVFKRKRTGKFRDPFLDELEAKRKRRPAPQGGAAVWSGSGEIARGGEGSDPDRRAYERSGMMTMKTIDMRPVRAALHGVPLSEEHYRALCLALESGLSDELTASGVVLRLALLSADVAAGRVRPVSGLPPLVVRMLFTKLESEIEDHVPRDDWAEIKAFQAQVEKKMRA